MSLPVAPWPDFAGQPIYDRSRIAHPDGTIGTVLHLPALGAGGEGWRVVYETGDMGRLQLQVGDKGQAVVIDAVPDPVVQQVRAWNQVWDRLATLDPAIRAETGGSGIASALASLERLLGEIPALRQQVATLTAEKVLAEAYRDLVFDGNAVYCEVKTRVDGIGVGPKQVATVLDAIHACAKQALKERS